MGAIASGGIRVLNEDTLRYLRIPAETVDAVVAREERELARRERAYRGTRRPLDVAGRTVILVDDGLATGASLRAAALALARLKPAYVVAAVPVGAAETCEEFRDVVDEIVCAETPEPFQAVGLWYDDFSQTTDDEVSELLALAQETRSSRDRERNPEYASRG